MHGQYIIARHTTSTLHAQSRLAKKHSQVSQTATTDTCVTENHSGNARCTMGPNDRNIEYVAAFPYLERTLHKSFYSRVHRKRKDRPTTKDYKSSMVREWTCPSCIGDVCSYCKQKKDHVTQEGPKSAALFCSARCRFPPCAVGCGKDRPRTDEKKSSIVREWTCKQCTKKSGL